LKKEVRKKTRKKNYNVKKKGKALIVLFSQKEENCSGVLKYL